MVYAPSFDPYDQYQRDPEGVINGALNRLDDRVTATIQHDFTSDGVTVTDAQMREAMTHEVTNCTVAGRTLTLPDGSGATQGPLFIASDASNTQSFSVIKGTTLIAIGPGEYRVFWNEDSINGLTEITSGGGSLIVPTSKRKTFSGCRAYHNATQNGTNAEWTTLAFNSEDFDDGGWHDNATNNDRLTVPAGVSRVRVAFHARTQSTANLAATTWSTAVSMNGGPIGALPGGLEQTNYFSATHNSNPIHTRDIDVVPGDYFQAHVCFWGVGTPVVESGLANCAFSIWAVSEPPYAAAATLDLVADYFPGTPGANAVIWAATITDDLNLADDLLGSQAHIGTNPSGVTVFNVDLNSSTIGTISISTGGVPTFATTGTGQETLAPGDLLEIVAPGTLNGIAGIAITLQATHA